MGSVRDKVALITGAANGIGAEVARRLHDKGARLVLIDLDETQLIKTAISLDDDRALTVVADVREFSAMQAAAALGIERFGGIDIVMANAGITAYGSVRQVDPDAFRALIDINVVGVFNTVRAALPSVIERAGYVMFVSSGAAYFAYPGTVPYSASKAAVEHFANVFRLEVADLAVDVGSAHLSWVDTPLVRDSKADLSTLRDVLDALPASLGQPTAVKKCGAALVRGMERRKRHVSCPRWVGLFRWLKPLFTSRVGERQILRTVPPRLARLDAEVATLGRSVSARTQALQKGLTAITDRP
ncbi:SDR family oxidoreductase [Mycobacterium shimoidei]|uniref:Putative oxidoreductase [Mycobacterium tuberculosis H37Rv] n=1 Tax=Mycobacterium shimoidei TaxID=29313 RepID=A0A1E3SXZ1_MYCSH|nr:SDR family oxidoreductase [Mycobacterium shimoidei]MCV7257068.1 SDR family oxidoreductase [Mycobacterium shimoidei]ODR06985.1 short-chain dehydrogenase [Mycobacterium shimoidei]ORW76875.1 short-chain dehydrogenase [Mycobacterium shimoidei]SRX94974.1 putative oxidoreductase [Mycobacterium tuberculosis H37Rv] [Mycobacterium shimoidei]